MLFSALLFPAIIISPLLMFAEFIINHLYAKIVIDPVKGQLISEKTNKRNWQISAQERKKGSNDKIMSFTTY